MKKIIASILFVILFIPVLCIATTQQTYVPPTSGEGVLYYVTTNGNITNNPLFVSIITTNQGTNYVYGDARLLDGSPCINTGTNQDWMTATNAIDLDFYPRIINSIVDMGVYEREYEREYVPFLYGIDSGNIRGSVIGGTSVVIRAKIF